MPTNNTIINKAGAIQTSTLTSGLLNPEQAKKFIQQTFEATNLGPLVRHVMRTSKTGEIDKIGIASRILRKKVENIDAMSDGSAPEIDPVTGQITGYRAKPNFAQIEYATKDVRLPWEITEETLRENIEGQQLEAIITNLMTTQLGIDLEDLYLNADTATDPTDDDYDFLKINDGWIKQLLAGSHVEDRTSKGSGAMSIDVFYDALKQIPNKYNNGKLRWLMSPRRKQDWDRYLLKQLIEEGGSVPESVYKNPASVPAIEVPALSDGKIILTDPKNLVVVNTYGVKIRKTTEGKEAIMQDSYFSFCIQPEPNTMLFCFETI